eukprot:5163226-Pyramimonas_sp.AAC.1
MSVAMSEFRLVKRGAGLIVNTRKTYVVFFGVEGKEGVVVQKLKDKGVEETDFQFAGAARYL